LKIALILSITFTIGFLLIIQELILLSKVRGRLSGHHLSYSHISFNFKYYHLIFLYYYHWL